MKKDEPEWVREALKTLRRAEEEVAAMTAGERLARYGDIEQSRFWEDWTGVDVIFHPK